MSLAAIFEESSAAVVMPLVAQSFPPAVSKILEQTEGPGGSIIWLCEAKWRRRDNPTSGVQRAPYKVCFAAFTIMAPGDPVELEKFLRKTVGTSEPKLVGPGGSSWIPSGYQDCEINLISRSTSTRYCGLAQLSSASGRVFGIAQRVAVNGQGGPVFFQGGAGGRI